MKRRLTLVLILCGMVVPTLAQAQRPTDAEVHRMNARILSTLDEYIRTASFSESSDVSTFRHLFVSADNPCVFNDLMGTPGFGISISPRDYADLIDTDAGSLLKFEIKTVRKQGDFFLKEGRWHRLISVDKDVLLIDASVYSGEQGGVFFESGDLFSDGKGTFHLVLDMVYNQEEDWCQIQSIQQEGKLPPSVLDNGTFHVILMPEDALINETRYKGEPLYFNEYGQAFISDFSQLSLLNENYAIRYTTEASSPLYDVTSLYYKKLHHLRIKPRYSMTVGGAFKLNESPAKVDFTADSKAFEAGLDLGFLFAGGAHSHWGLYIGAAYSSSQIAMSAGGSNLKYDYFAGRTDATRLYILSSATESLGFTDVMFPLYMETEFSLGKYVNLSWDLGAKFYLNLDNQLLTPYRVEGQVYDGSATRDISLDSQKEGLLDPGSYGKEPYDLSFFTNLELDIRLYKGIFLFASGGYEYGLPSLLPAFAPSKVKTYYNASSSGTPVYPVVYGLHQGAGRDMLYRPLSSAISFTRQGIWLSFGFKFKLNV